MSVIRTLPLVAAYSTICFGVKTRFAINNSHYVIYHCIHFNNCLNFKKLGTKEHKKNAERT